MKTLLDLILMHVKSEFRLKNNELGLTDSEDFFY